MCSKCVVCVYIYIVSLRYGNYIYIILHTFYTRTSSSYVHGLSSFSYSDSLFTMDAPPDPRSQIPDPRSHTPQIPQHLLTSTVSSHSPIVIHFSPWTHHSHLILFTPDPRSQIPRTTNSTASSYVHGLISFFYSDSLFTVDAPFTPHPVHTRS